MWVTSFLSARTICTMVGSALSSSRPLRSGVVQGSCIGPLLFVLNVSDVGKKIFSFNTISRMFADDLRLCTELELNSCYASLQNELDLLSCCSIRWHLTVSSLKC